jgi:caffeoyl-CoA O-methyltransferase
MSESIGLSAAIVDYLAHVNPEEHPALVRCREETAGMGVVARMQISAEQGAFMRTLAFMIRARRAIEVGVFTGYSSTAIALALQEMHGDDAHLLACDVSEEFTNRAKHIWGQANVHHIIDLELAPAAETLDRKIAQGLSGEYDLAFIDADKEGYPIYYERCLTLLRVGGIMLFDNVLWHGAVADPKDKTADTVALRAVAQKAKTDPRVHAAMTSIGDGLLICVKR